MGVEPTETTAPAAKDFAVIFNKVVEASEKAKLSMKVQVDKPRLQSRPASLVIYGQLMYAKSRF